MKALFLALFAVLLGACTATEQREQPSASELAGERGYQLGEEVEEVYNYRVSGWNYVSDRALILPAGPGTRYLLMLDRACPELGHTEVIGFTSTLDHLRSGFDAVLVREHPSDIKRRCYIEQIYKLEKDSGK